MKTIQNTSTKLLKSIPVDSEIPNGWTDILDDKIKGVWNGSEWIESSTKEEIEAHNQQFEINKKKIEREALLNKGIVVDEFWFNEYYLAQFISLIGVCEMENKQIEWKNIKHEWVLLLIHEANSIAFQASMKFQEIYKTT